MNGSFIETFLEKSTNIPRDIARNFKLVKELDDKANKKELKLEELRRKYLAQLKINKSRTKDDIKNDPDLAEIESEYQNKVNLINQKIKVTSECYDLIYTFINRTIDPIIFEFEKCVKDLPQHEKVDKKPLHFISETNNNINGGKKRGNDYITSGEEIKEIYLKKKKNRPTTKSKQNMVENDLSLNQQQSDLLLESDVIDKNEELYCYCNGVSFGDMVGCENPKCKIAWFHFLCVGLTETPEGSWYCKECSAMQNTKAKSKKSKK